jgi:hypothetical protein
MIWLAFNEFFHDNVASQDQAGTRFPEAEAVNSRCARLPNSSGLRGQPGQSMDFRPIPDFSISAFQHFSISAFHNCACSWRPGLPLSPPSMGW